MKSSQSVSQSVSQSAFSSPNLVKSDKGEVNKFDSTRPDFGTDYRKGIKTFQSNIKQLNFPEIPSTSKKTPRPVMILERVKIVSGPCEENPRTGLENLERPKNGSVLPVISYKKTIHKSLKKLRTTPIIITSLNKSPDKVNSCRYTNDNFFQNKELYGLRNSVPLVKLDRWGNPEFTLLANGNCKSNPSILSYQLSPKSQREIIEDDFHYTNIFKNSEFTSFFHLLECQFETYPNPFPYCGKILKTIPKRRNLNRKTYTSKTREFQLNQTTVQPDLFSLSTNEPILSVPKISRIFFHPRNVLSPKSLIIINLLNNQQISESWETWDNIKKASQIFQVIFIVHQDYEVLLQTCESLSIKIAGLYLLPNLTGYVRELSKMQDYSQIFQDFKCKNLQKNVLIVAYHLLHEVEEIEKSILTSIGTLRKIEALRIPSPFLDYPELPLTLLLPYNGQGYEYLQILLSLISEPFNLPTDFLNFFRHDMFFLFEINFSTWLQNHYFQLSRNNLRENNLKAVIFKPNN